MVVDNRKSSFPVPNHSSRNPFFKLASSNFAAFTFSGWIATLAGWIVTEVGRQPWMVTGVLLVKDSVGPITGAQLGTSLTGYAVTYGLMFIAYMVVLTHMAGKGAGGHAPSSHAASEVLARRGAAPEGAGS